MMYETFGGNQKQMENVLHNKIREINKTLKKCNETLADWENRDPRLARYTKEEYQEDIVKELLKQRSYYIRKMLNVRKGICFE